MRVCPGCGLTMPRRDTARNDGYYNASPECWSVYTEVLAAEYSNAVLFGQVHQLTVDTYAVQHAGGPHPDKSVFIHLSGLHLVLERGLRPTTVPPLLQQLATRMQSWPHYQPPADVGPLTVCDIALAEDHGTLVRQWALQVWRAWSAHHPEIARIVSGFALKEG
jgi:hypothetical protein